MDQGLQHKLRYPETHRKDSGNSLEPIDTGKDFPNRTLNARHQDQQLLNGTPMK